jgi:CHAP domain
MGNSYDGVAACGTAYGDGGNSNEQGPVSYDGVRFDSVGFQCVELVMRYMYYDFGSAPYSANGNTVVSNYRGSLFTKETDPAADGLPSVGDILSFAGTSSNPDGHTAIVIGVSSSSLSTLNENDTANGLDKVPVSNGVVRGGVTGWLHAPGNRPPPSIDSFTVSSAVASGSGGAFQLAAAASDATEYSFTSSDPGVQGLSTVSSGSGSARVEITLPQENDRTSTISFTVAVSGPGGTTSASTSVISTTGRSPGQA